MPPAALTLSVLTFGLPMLAWGAMAAGVPVLVHLVLRQRPRRQVLPTLRFVIQAQKSSTRMHRLKRLVLLACRMAVILLVVGLLMKTGCAPSDPPAQRAHVPLVGPVSFVIAIDDSASMQYRYQGRTRLEDASAGARALLADPERFSSGSEVSILTGSSGATAAVGWTRDRSAAAKALRDIPAGWHDRSVAALLRHAYGLIANATHPRREVYLLTDLSQTAWNDSLPLPPQELAGVFILDVGRNENRNLALSRPEVPTATLPADQTASCRIQVRSGDAGATCTVTLTIDGTVRDRQSMTLDSADTAMPISFALPPLSEGPHALTFRLSPDDALSIDNQRFASVAAGAAPEVLVVGEETGHSVADMIAAMLAPPAQPVAEHRFRVRRVGGDSLAGALVGNPLAVILGDPPGLTPVLGERLTRYVSAGGRLIAIPGSNASAEAYRVLGGLLPAPVRGVTTTPGGPITLAAADMSLHYLKPFADPGVDSINDRQVYRRLELGPLESGSSVVTPFSDGTPAILERAVAAGRVVQFGFSPERDWSQFGTQAAPMIVLLHSMIEALSPRPVNVDSFVAGRTATHRWPEPPGATLRIRTPAGVDLPIEPSGKTTALPSGEPGHYRLSFGGQETTTPLLYDVNVAESESEPDRLSRAAVAGRFPAGLAHVVGGLDQLPARDSGPPGTVGWTVPLALALAGLLWFETLFANRFYARRGGGGGPPSKTG